MESKRSARVCKRLPHFSLAFCEKGGNTSRPFGVLPKRELTMTLFAKQHERRGYPTQGNTWSPADRAAMCLTSDLSITVVRIRS